jgi:formylglycine-generating enzyme required for sulfatase activity
LEWVLLAKCGWCGIRKIPTDPDFVRQLRAEGKLQHKLRHPHIVQTHDLNTQHNPPYFVMEYVEGENLRQRLNRDGKLSEAEALDILRQILEALVYAHGEGVLHRDLKPENILIQKNGTIKITDFGLSKVQAEVTQSLILSGNMQTVEGKSVSGTYEYMSPEQRQGKEPSASDDLYAVGITGCELLLGKRPPASGLGKALERAGIGSAWAGFLDKACDELEYRYVSAAEMLAALPGNQGAVQKATQAAKPEPPPVITSPPSSGHNPKIGDIKTLDLGRGVKLELCWILPGEFLMGSNAFNDEKPIHTVRITRGFWMGKYEVTQEQYEAVMGNKPSNFKGAQNPVESVSWDDAVAFCKKVGVRLPTEAEWEYACRAGTTTKYSSGDSDSDLDGVAWYTINSRNTTHPGGQKQANAWGLYDMHGNVWEWCADWYGSYPSGEATNPAGSSSGTARVLRGGSWCFYPGFCRSAIRGWYYPGNRDVSVGFRVCLDFP